MRIISRKTLRLFWERREYADAEQPLKAWFKQASSADWDRCRNWANPFPLLTHAEHVGDEVQRLILIEDHHVVDRLQGCRNVCPISLTGDGPIGALSTPDRRSGINSNHERVALCAATKFLPTRVASVYNVTEYVNAFCYPNSPDF
jgi:mRNA-degrading endonuclease HigB of HigAB toxin-antitoxin module